MNKLLTKQDLFSLRYIIIYLLIVYGIFVYSSLAGYKLFGTDTEKWEAGGHGQHTYPNQSTNRTLYNSNGSYHK